VQHIKEVKSVTANLKLSMIPKPIRFRSEHVVRRLFTNRFEEVDYKFAQGFVFVVTKDQPATIKTVELVGGKKLNEDFWLVE